MKDKKNKTKKGGIDEMRLCGAMFELEQFTSRSLGSDAATTTLVFPFAERMASTIAIDGVHIELRSLLI